MVRSVLWLGGMSGVGKTTAARRVARRHDLWLYSVDARTYAHAEEMRVPALTMTVDELWLDHSPEQMAVTSGAGTPVMNRALGRERSTSPANAAGQPATSWCRSH